MDTGNAFFMRNSFGMGYISAGKSTALSASICSDGTNSLIGLVSFVVFGVGFCFEPFAVGGFLAAGGCLRFDGSWTCWAKIKARFEVCAIASVVCHWKPDTHHAAIAPKTRTAVNNLIRRFCICIKFKFQRFDPFFTRTLAQ